MLGFILLSYFLIAGILNALSYPLTNDWLNDFIGFVWEFLIGWYKFPKKLAERIK